MLIIRGDDYQSWIYKSDNEIIVVDPWLTEKQKFPGASWLLNRYRSKPHYLVKHNLIKKVTHIIITAHFSDHLDLDSIKMFPKDIQIYTTHHASKIIKKAGFKNCIIVKPGDEYKFNNFSLKINVAGKPYHTSTFSYYLKTNKTTIFHEPHTIDDNFRPTDKIDVLISTIDSVKVLGLVEVSMDIKKTSKILHKNEINYMIPTGIHPNKTKGFIRLLLSIKESISTEKLILPILCKHQYDTFTI